MLNRKIFKDEFCSLAIQPKSLPIAITRSSGLQSKNPKTFYLRNNVPIRKFGRLFARPSIRLSVRCRCRWHAYVCPSVRQSVNPSIRQSVNPSIRQSVNPSIHWSSQLVRYRYRWHAYVCPSVCQSVRLFNISYSIKINHIKTNKPHSIFICAFIPFNVRQ